MNSRKNTSSNRNKCGVTGEQEARRWLEMKGFTICHTNWRSGRFEVDIIASRNQVLHFVEVKASRQQRRWHPEDRVNLQKLNHLKEAAGNFLTENHSWRNIQIDIVAVLFNKEANPEIHYIPDVGD